jgi:hypothetical protein
VDVFGKRAITIRDSATLAVADDALCVYFTDCFVYFSIFACRFRSPIVPQGVYIN